MVRGNASIRKAQFGNNPMVDAGFSENSTLYRMQFFPDRIVPAERAWAIALRGSDVLNGAVGLLPERVLKLPNWAIGWPSVRRQRGVQLLRQERLFCSAFKALASPVSGPGICKRPAGAASLAAAR
ncbi:hypothetical protein [Sphingomonas sp. NFX23]|uniref:hypothetical protein n=1 Tax=Sphingomonas sp. NFX23 TaxID=2819532 RepID=UPI003CFA44BA